MSDDKWKPSPSFDASAVVKSDYKRHKYSPEISIYGVHYTVGEDQNSREEASALAQTVVNALNAKFLQTIQIEIIAKYPEAKP